MAFRLENRIGVAAPASVIWDLVSDLEGWDRWNPLYRAGLSQMDISIPWYAFPGANGVKVTQTMVDNIATVIEQKATPEAALREMAQEVTRLLPR